MKYHHKLPDTSVNVTKENVLVQGGKLLLWLLFIGIGFYFLLSLVLGFVVEHITPAQEKRLISLMNFTPQMESEKHNTYLQELTDKLIPCVNLPYQIETYIIDTKERNAFAMPSGKIYITKGMLKEIKNENELVGIIGHELGHFKHKDHLKGLGNSLILAFASLFLENHYGMVFDSGLKLSQAKYSQQAEFDADSYALEVMQCGYGNVASATTLFQRMDDGKKWHYFLETHPDFTSRIEKMKAEIEEKGYNIKAEIKPLKEKF
jgi:Zn-dependent protease with chaperone function